MFTRNLDKLIEGARYVAIDKVIAEHVREKLHLTGYCQWIVFPFSLKEKEVACITEKIKRALSHNWDVSVISKSSNNKEFRIRGKKKQENDFGDLEILPFKPCVTYEMMPTEVGLRHVNEKIKSLPENAKRLVRHAFKEIESWRSFDKDFVNSNKFTFIMSDVFAAVVDNPDLIDTNNFSIKVNTCMAREGDPFSLRSWVVPHPLHYNPNKWTALLANTRFGKEEAPKPSSSDLLDGLSEEKKASAREAFAEIEKGKDKRAADVMKHLVTGLLRQNIGVKVLYAGKVDGDSDKDDSDEEDSDEDDSLPEIDADSSPVPKEKPFDMDALMRDLVADSKSSAERVHGMDACAAALMIASLVPPKESNKEYEELRPFLDFMEQQLKRNKMEELVPILRSPGYLKWARSSKEFQSMVAEFKAQKKETSGKKADAATKEDEALFLEFMEELLHELGAPVLAPVVRMPGFLAYARKDMLSPEYLDAFEKFKERKAANQKSEAPTEASETTDKDAFEKLKAKYLEEMFTALMGANQKSEAPAEASDTTDEGAFEKLKAKYVEEGFNALMGTKVYENGTLVGTITDVKQTATGDLNVEIAPKQNPSEEQLIDVSESNADAPMQKPSEEQLIEADEVNADGDSNSETSDEWEEEEKQNRMADVD